MGTSFGGHGGDGGADPINIIASCKASVATARAAVSPVDGTGKGTGLETSSASVSWPAPGTSTSVRVACGKSAMAVVKKKIACDMYLIYGTYDEKVNVSALHNMHQSQLQ